MPVEQIQIIMGKAWGKVWEKFKEKIYNQQRLLTIDIHLK